MTTSFLIFIILYWEKLLKVITPESRIIGGVGIIGRGGGGLDIVTIINNRGELDGVEK